jgi:Cu-processing system ATP-binding protein
MHLMQPIQITNLHKAFGPVDVLNGVDLAFHPAETTAIVGPNGAGKTTLIKCILGLTHSDRGNIDVLGRSIKDGVMYRDHIGYMPQQAHFPENLSGRQMMAMVRSLRCSGHSSPDIDHSLLRTLHLDADLDKPFRVLSGGTRQKISALLAFMVRPSILILDEPTAGLDPVSSAALKDHIMERRAEGASVVLTSHVLADLEELADRVVFLLDGRIRFDGALDELRTMTGEHRLERAIATLLEGEAA